MVEGWVARLLLQNVGVYYAAARRAGVTGQAGEVTIHTTGP